MNGYQPVRVVLLASYTSQLLLVSCQISIVLVSGHSDSVSVELNVISPTVTAAVDPSASIV